MKEQVSERIIDQRIRNRIMEAVATLAEGDEGLRPYGPGEYFESFYDWIPHRDDGVVPINSAIAPEERALLLEVSCILDDACDATHRNINAEAFIETGWPKVIQPIALKALNFMRQRGRFREDQEEESPSL